MSVPVSEISASAVVTSMPSMRLRSSAVAEFLAFQRVILGRWVDGRHGRGALIPLNPIPAALLGSVERRVGAG